MKLIILIALATAIIKALQKERARREKERAEQERQRIREEQARQREEIRQQIELAKEQTRRQIALEREQMKLRREQERQRIEQERQAREQERQRKEQTRQAEQIAALDFRISQAETDIANGQERTAGLYALLDIAIAAQQKTEPGSPEEERAQRKILSLTNQINSTERKIAKAQYDKEAAQRRRTA